MNLSVQSVERLADIETPVSAYLKLCKGKPDSFLLESVETKYVTGRYSIVAYDPLYSMELGPESAVIRNNGSEESAPAAEFFNLIKSGLDKLKLETPSPLPAVGSLMGYVGYDAVRLIERLPNPRPGVLPVARLVFPSRFVLFDHVRRVMILLAIGNNETACAEKIDDMTAALRGPRSFPATGRKLEITPPPPERYHEAVRKAKQYIREGDIFQVVLSDVFEGETDMSPFEAYRRLRVRSPSPYMFYADFGAYQLVGASPETLVKVKDKIVTIMPIAGTRGRSEDTKRDRELEEELITSDKEFAEHLMLVDLARNDVGRVARYGTVNVDPYRTVERYSHVMHIVCQVQGRLRDEMDAVDAFMAGFPAGTVSGAPKVRAMEIIDELECSNRGPYAGAVGYFGPGNVTDTCIAIRVILFEQDRFTIRVGAGIVADSEPKFEYKEIQNKAAQSIYALQAAARGES